MNISPLQLALALAGGLLLLAIGLHGWWLSRRNLPRQASPAPASSAVNDAGGMEPVLDDAALELSRFPLPVPEKKPLLDALIDGLASIALENPVSGDAALAALPPTRRVGSKPFAVEGYNELDGRWELPVPGQRYSAFQTGVQLTNRAGAINNIEFSEFVVKTHAFCDLVNGTPEFPDMQEEVSRARELEHFASAHDAQLGLVLHARQAAWSPGYVQQSAARLGFVPGLIPGRMVLPASSPGLPPVLSLSFDTQAALADDPAQSALREVALSLDVPQVSPAEQAFERMRDISSSLAASMDGSLTDQEGAPLSAAALDHIAVDLHKLYALLDEREFAAGSSLARRLFS